MGPNCSRLWSWLLSAMVAVLLMGVSVPVWAQEEPPPPPEPEQVTPEAGQVVPEGNQPPSVTDQDQEKLQPSPRPGLPVAKGPISLTKVKDPKTGKMVIKITNDDLERVYGKGVVPRASAIKGPDTGAPPPTGAEGKGPSSPAAGPGPAPAAKIQQISQDIERQKKLLSNMTNPFQTRPKLTDEEKAERKGKGAAEVYRETQEKLSGLEQEMKKLQEKEAEETEDSSQE